MRSIILCEGFDDNYIIGYYLYKTKKWVYNKSGKISKMYELPKVNKNQIIEVYEKGSDRLIIWSVGGKDNFKKAFEFLNKINTNYPDERINQVFVFADRDMNDIDTCIKSIMVEMNDEGINIQKLKNDCINIWDFEIEEQKYEQKIIPIIIPFEEEGAVETLLMNAIAENGYEDEFIIEEAKSYILKYLERYKDGKYLKHERQRLKAKFSAVISITNPDRSTTVFNNLLTSSDWEKSSTIKKHLHMFDELL